MIDIKYKNRFIVEDYYKLIYKRELITNHKFQIGGLGNKLLFFSMGNLIKGRKVLTWEDLKIVY